MEPNENIKKQMLKFTKTIIMRDFVRRPNDPWTVDLSNFNDNDIQWLITFLLVKKWIVQNRDDKIITFCR